MSANPIVRFLCVVALAASAAGSMSCQLQKIQPKPAAERDAESAAIPEDGGPSTADASGGVKSTNDETLGAARKAVNHKDGDSIPQILAKTREQLQQEVTKNLQLTESLQRSNARIVELDNAGKNSVKELEVMRIEREKLQSKIRELQERLVTAALRIASAEKETLEVKIAYEKAVTTAAESGVLLDVHGSGAKPASRPSAGGDRKATASAKPAGPDQSGVKSSERH